ncbi:myosin IB heavy chain, putative [Trypanosoma brucei gambiense DAL972]|uniref:Myosin IB heavy chain, putative n=1 Tax=Trypanosoma brucei gambiense (strain MHOM/CI/86/DAL972) TaxID=679716 RepID=C9ZMY4_TRYB9|nr:myosin IB heavy chain, putative [Trypanosoma brucei gambiense DAL972]CBH10638.1 myosin IB heavy chain, putative [Trypanosoma brucei gambiense DAL972]|eukprot:XP_011772926.1 myosin IB heavy chain, putative [Trypanosoma brucei gambiense DAL972]
MAHLDLNKQPMVGVEDLVLLPQLSDKAIMENLKLRHSKDLIYTSIGSVLLSVNPFKNIPNLYSDECVAYFRNGGKGEGSGSYGGPHIFGLAEETYRTMVSDGENQCVIISGESGAGKTEASKHIMRYISAVSGDTEEMQRVKHIILASNPVLEAFGNAKTVRNDNSSRFGKFFEIFFDQMGGPIGGRLSNFLLEKSRVVSQQKGERNFHVFYQMCCGAKPELREKLRLRDPGNFAYLNQGGVHDRSGIDDVRGWEEMLTSMETLMLTPEKQQAIFETLSLILHLGELQFGPPSSASVAGGDSNTLVVSNRDELEFCAGLLGADAAAMEKAFTKRRLAMGANEVVDVPLDAQQCRNTRDAMAKTLYHYLFDFVVDSVNTALGKKQYDLMLGVLDIYGFEVFNKNGFEQFCINYVNEKLQQIFIELTLKVEQEEYVREKIPWEEIKYFNNKVVCDLIEGMQPPGLFPIFDDVCATMAKEKESVADIKMLDKLDAVHAGNRHFNRTERGFFVKHYAGDVHYDADGFTNRNKDTLSPDLIGLLRSVTNRFILDILAETLNEAAEAESAAVSGAGGRKKRSTTAGSKIRQQAGHLVKTLMACNPHYLRTIKSNDEKRADFIDEARVQHQVKYLGLLENLRVRRAGYSYRKHFDKFIKRFKYLSSATFPRPFKGSDRDACAAILKQVGGRLPDGSWQLGQQKLFIRQPQHLSILEELRDAALSDIVYKIQRAWRRYLQNKHGILLKAGMGRMYTKASKVRRADSVFRPYLGEYLDYRTQLAPMHPIVDYDPVGGAWKEYWSDGGKKYYYNYILEQSQWECPREMQQRRILFTATVERVYDHQQALIETDILIVTDMALYLFTERIKSLPPPAEKGPKKKATGSAPIPASSTVQFVLQKRIDLRLLSGLSVTKHADTVLVIHTYQPSVPYRTVICTPIKSTRSCECCGCKLTPATKKQNCPGCGRLCCLKNCLPFSRPLPMLLAGGKDVRVCPNCVSGEPYEPVEDIVLLSPMKTEMVAVLRKAYHQLMGNKLHMNINDSLGYNLFGEEQQRQLTAIPYSSSSDTTITPGGPNTLVVSAPAGITKETIDAIEAAREQRRQAVAEQRRKEEEEERAREAEREREREEEHKRIVEERRRARAAAAEAAEAERLHQENAARERREAEARVVEQRSKR